MMLVSQFARKLGTIDELPGRRRSGFPEITDPLFWRLYQNASRFSMVHLPGFNNLFQSMTYIARNKLPGDIIECGCFLGGCGIFLALLCNHFHLSEKTIYLFDTFEGFPAGQEEDSRLGNPVKSSSYANIERHVRENIAAATPGEGGPLRIELVPGFVEKTLPNFAVGQVCLLRLDTDFYNSTKVEFEVLYEHLVPGGVLIIDDYGLYAGARKATDEYFARLDQPPLLNRIDRGVWAGVKP